MKILSIETSCDDTAITLMETKITKNKQASFQILANASNSQIKIHAEYGGVFPAFAKREHIKNLPILLEEVSKLAKKDLAKEVDLIAVTYGPGLEPSLWCGIVFAKELAEKWSIPLIPVNHMEGHILSAFGKSDKKFSVPLSSNKQNGIKFPLLSLLVSGGHTELVLSKKFLQYEIIGETLDDAVGEAYDKVARMLGLSYPGGPEISKLAEAKREKIVFEGTPQGDGPRTEQIFQQKNCDPSKIDFLPLSLPRPMLHSKNYNFSFSGLKTAVLYLIRDLQKENPEILKDNEKKAQIALEFENAVVETLVYKTLKAIEKYKIKTVIVGGGVSCNKHLQREMTKAINPHNRKVKLLFPENKLTGDNAIMIGISGFLQFIKNKQKVPKISKIKAEGNLRLK